MAENNNNQELVQLLQMGDVYAFDSLFEIYSSKLYGFALKYFKNESDSEELVQEVFVKVWENRQTLKSELSFKSYLFTIALNQIRKYFNKKANALRYLESLRVDPDFLRNETFQNDDYEIVLQQINCIIEEMPPRRREIFIKSKLEGKSSKEIAAELNISPGTIDNHVSDGLHFIRTRLSKDKIAVILFTILFLS